MIEHICVFEDAHYRDFHPLTLTRPVYLMRAGIFPQYERIRRILGAQAMSFICRNQVAPVLAEQVPDYPVNIVKRGDSDVLFVNGRIRSFGDLPRLLADDRYTRGFESDGQLVAMLLKADMLKELSPVASHEDYIRFLSKEDESIPRHTTTASLYRHAWEFVDDVKFSVTSDFRVLESEFGAPESVKVHDGAFFVNENDVFLGNGITVMPGSVIDASKGPVYIGDNVMIEPHASITGPCYIGPNSVVLAGKITGCSVGHTSRVGGELEKSVLQAYVNKYHAGFIGHSYVGQWVNFGAMTTNSDLKNNYSPIRVSVNGESIDTGSIKVGSFIGDHTKFGIGTLLNTGISIGVCCNIFGGTLVADKEVSSFCWGSTGEWTSYRFDKALETAQRTTERRGVKLSEREAGLLQAIADNQLTDEGVLSL